MVPFLTRRTFGPGELLFRKGDSATHLYLLYCDGPDAGDNLGVSAEGAMIGEIGLFAPDHERTTSAVCETSVAA